MADLTLDPWQYQLTGEPASDSVAIGKMWLRVGSDLPIIPVTDADGQAAGFLLGFPIDLAARQLIRKDWRAPVRLQAGPDGFSRAVLLALAGRFLWIQTLAGGVRIYPDCSAQVSCVYDPVLRIAGSTAFALLDAREYADRLDQAAFDRLGIDGEGWFPAGLTAHRGIKRLLPNHYLDLDQWRVRRFWPQAALQSADNPDDSVDEIIGIIRAQFEALLGGPKRLALGLTAGHETRMLLACARPYLKDIDFLTVSGGDRHEVDTVMARRIASDLNLSHMSLPRLVATKEQRARFIERGGHCNADSNSHFHPSVWPIARSHVLAGGAGGEVARAFFWRSGDAATSVLTPQRLIGRFGLAETAALAEALDHWQAELSAMDARLLLDIAYLEHRDGAWYAAQFCCDPTLLRIAPLLTFRAVELMMGLPVEWKLTDRLGHAIIERLWPELERYPYNSLGRWKDTMIKLQRVALDPRLIFKKLRKLRS